ncbi:HDL378Cp [Eremothecium sinecaudum]|uniref:non-specific serine/threonine protein kinase n=1 Tax=Eremothecium sinecaudum TaxID=45286 RepID=A0A0X8HQY8_9SACH|nr:HDL378Cp [Eremothecium sinecaudum]AMD20366.1 HDL378Cp [Eremothecium sinecaudum]
MPQQVRISRENSVKRSRSFTKSFKGLFKSRSPTPPPSSRSTSASSATYVLQSPKHLPLSGLVKLSLSPRAELQSVRNNKSEESMLSDDSSLKMKNAPATAEFYSKDNGTDSSSSVLLAGEFAGSDLRTGTECSSKLSYATESLYKTAVESDADPSIDAQLDHSMREAAIHAPSPNKRGRSLQRSQSATVSKFKDRTPHGSADPMKKETKKPRYVIQDEHFRVDESGHHEHILKIMPLIQDIDCHKTKSGGFWLSSVFKLHRHEDGEMNIAHSILPSVKPDLEGRVSMAPKEGFTNIKEEDEEDAENGHLGIVSATIGAVKDAAARSPHMSGVLAGTGVAAGVVVGSIAGAVTGAKEAIVQKIKPAVVEQDQFDENYGHELHHGKDKMPKVVNKHAAIGSDELKLINNLAERINDGIEHLDKNSPAEVSPNVKNIKAKQILAEKYGKCIGMVGHGAYGTVWVTSKDISHANDDVSSHHSPCKGTFEHNGRLFYALKELKPRVDESHEKFSTRLTSEFVIGHSLSGRLGIVNSSTFSAHPNILKVFDLMQTHDAFVEVFEFCPSGDLYNLLTRSGKSGSGLHPLEADCFMKQLLNGVQYMHEHGVAHCDLKPENILFTPTGVLKICDFGSSSVFQTAWEKNVHFQTGKVGSEPYVAPEEFIPNREYDSRLVDCWSCGIIYCTMVLGHYLWKVANKDKDQIYSTFVEEMTERGEYSVFEEMRHVNQELNRCRKMCLYNVFQWQPKKRIPIPKLLETPWMRKTVCCINYKYTAIQCQQQS